MTRSAPNSPAATSAAGEAPTSQFGAVIRPDVFQCASRGAQQFGNLARWLVCVPGQDYSKLASRTAPARGGDSHKIVTDCRASD